MVSRRVGVVNEMSYGVYFQVRVKANNSLGVLQDHTDSVIA